MYTFPKVVPAEVAGATPVLSATVRRSTAAPVDAMTSANRRALIRHALKDDGVALNGPSC